MMINREATIRWKGYDPNGLKSQSNKRVWANCEECGIGRWVNYQSYCDLCFKCAMILRSGEGHAMYGKRGSETGMYGKKAWNSGLTKDSSKILDKMSKDMIGKFDGSDNPNYNHKIDKFMKENINKHICKCGCGRYIIIIRQHYYSGIPEYIAGHSFKGENNPMFGREQRLESRMKSSCTHRGISIEEFDNFNTDYCDKFTQKLRTKIRDRYNNCDFISGLPDYICNVLNGKVWKLDVHHVDYNTQQGCDDYKWILIPLSRSNHAKTNGGSMRYFWNRLFVYSLEYDKEYYKLDNFNI